jgi:hypothetical protein
MTGYCEPIRLHEWHEPDTKSSWAEPHEGVRYRERQTRLAFTAELSALVKARSVAATKPQEQLLQLSRRFQEQAEKWERETGHLSSPTQRMMHPSYQAILGMGREHKRDMVVLLIQDMQQHYRPWFGALSYLTQENPLERADAGKMDKMIASWVEWGKSTGLL